jgi:UV DNA damage endonuclease
MVPVCLCECLPERAGEHRDGRLVDLDLDEPPVATQPDRLDRRRVVDDGRVLEKASLVGILAVERFQPVRRDGVQPPVDLRNQAVGTEARRHPLGGCLPESALLADVVDVRSSVREHSQDPAGGVARMCIVSHGRSVASTQGIAENTPTGSGGIRRIADRCRSPDPEYGMLGYAAMNHTLREQDPPRRCNRDMHKKTWESEGLAYAGELAAKNFADLREILQWNLEHDIRFYRCSSKLVPWNSQFDLEALPNSERIRSLARECGRLVRKNDLRLTFHPSHWCKLASESDDTVARSVESVSHHGRWLDLMELPRSPRYAINVHIGAHYGDKAATADRFCDVVTDLPPRARERLTVENDDTESLWGVEELVESVATRADVPVTFDYHHHSFTDRGLTYREGFELARDTWGDVRPITHYSEPARLHGEGDARPQDHAEHVASVPEWLRRESDVLIESHGKERSLLRVRDAS